MPRMSFLAGALRERFRLLLGPAKAKAAGDRDAVDKESIDAVELHAFEFSSNGLIVRHAVGGGRRQRGIRSR